MATIDLFPFNINASDAPLQGSILAQQLVVLVLDELIDQSTTIGGCYLIQDILDRSFVPLKLSDFALKVLGPDMLLFGLGVFPAFHAFGFLEGEQRKLRIVACGERRL